MCLKNVFSSILQNEITNFFITFKLILITSEIFAHPRILDSDVGETSKKVNGFVGQSCH